MRWIPTVNKENVNSQSVTAKIERFSVPPDLKNVTIRIEFAICVSEAFMAKSDSKSAYWALESHYNRERALGSELRGSLQKAQSSVAA